MKIIQGKPRNQWEMYCLDAHVDAENEVRLIDLFVDSLNLSELGFKVDFEENGRPAYLPGASLRLFIYGYLNRIRSSRQLEKECKRNLELMQLMPELQPDHNTIAHLRKNNPKHLQCLASPFIQAPPF
jgi:transposase